MGLTLDDAFAIYDQHAGIESKSANTPHASKPGGTATSRIRVKNKPEKLKQFLLQKERIEHRRAQGSFTNAGGRWNS